jgi:hypothetical protein
VQGKLGDTGAQGVQGKLGDTGAVGAQGAQGASISQPVFFCGELGAASDAFFAGPNLEVFSGAHTDHTFASTACDVLGHTDVEMADLSLDADSSYSVEGMFCQISASGAVTTTMTFVEAGTATPITCDIGAGKTSCTDVGTSEPVAAGAEVAVSSLSSADQSTEDVHCIVYISWD